MKKKTKSLFKDYRRTNDGVMVADVGFKKQLWALDPELDLAWDAVADRWEIWKFPGQARKPLKVLDVKAVHVASIMTKSQSFREVGADVLIKLQQGDTRRFSVKQIADYLDKMDDNIQRVKRKTFMDEMEAIERDTAEWWTKLRNQVPFAYDVKPHEEDLVLKVPLKKANHYEIKIPRSRKIARGLGG